MRKSTVALTGSFAALTIGLGVIAYKPQEPEKEVVEAATPAPGDVGADLPFAAATVEVAVSGDVNLVSWLRPGPWRWQRCVVNGPVRYLPMLWVPEGSRCEAGRPIKVRMVEGGRNTGVSKQPAWLILASKTLPVPAPLDIHGMPGCFLELPLTPEEGLVTVAYLPPGSRQVGLAKRTEGANYDIIEFEWTPGAQHVGQRLFLQGLWGAPGQNAMGLLVTDAVELLVGAGS